MTGSIALQQPVNRYAAEQFGIKKKFNRIARKQKSKTTSRQRYFCLPDNDTLTLTELMLISQYRFIRG